MFAPFALLPYGVARMAWLGLGQARIAVALIVWWRSLRPAPVLLAAGLVVTAGYQPLFESIAVGQLGLPMLALASLGIAAHAAGRPLVAAVPLVFGTWWLPGWWRTAGAMTGESPWLHVWPRNISPHALLHRLFGTEGMLLAPCLLLLARVDRLSRAGRACFVAGTVLVAARYSVAAFPFFASGVPSLALAAATLCRRAPSEPVGDSRSAPAPPGRSEP